MSSTIKTVKWINMLLAAWIAVSPAIFDFTSGGGFTILAGIVLIVLGFIMLKNPEGKAVHWISLIITIFMFFAPWIFGFTGGAAVNIRVVTILMVISKVISLPKTSSSQERESHA